MLVWPKLVNNKMSTLNVNISRWIDGVEEVKTARSRGNETRSRRLISQRDLALPAKAVGYLPGRQCTGSHDIPP